jgi:ubiquinone/menaquinone biosynthesis C-methylase UbiE
MGIEELYREPYLEYERVLTNLIKPDMTVLEVGSGFGMHTKMLLDLDAHVSVLDISPKSIELLKKYFINCKNLNAYVGDIEALPFANNEFDLICCAGSLSYGAPDLVFSEIYRVLKKGGHFVCVDSLNNNAVYKFNRYLQYLMGIRTEDTIKHMPTVSSISGLYSFFEVQSKYYGSILWILRPLEKIFRMKNLAKLSSKFDKIFYIKKSAFKFVCVAKK